jgi:O-antigen/teichoic acid export membrane protein
MDNNTRESMGRGTLYLMIASAVFLVTGYAIHFGLGRYLGPETYGIYGVVLSLMTTINLLLTTGFPQGASKYIAEDNVKLSSIVRHSTRIQVLFSLLIFAIYFGLAGVIANLFNDPNLTLYIRISASVIPFYALYAIYSDGYLNGLREFGKQARTLTVASVAKVGMVFLLVLLGLSVKGAILGYLLAAVVGWLLAWRYLGAVGESSANFEWSKLVKFGIPATLFAAMLYLIMSIDLFAVKAISGEDVDTGLYTAATTIAKVPYFIFGGLALALLPSISRSTSVNDSKLTASYINQSMRYMLMLLIPGVLLISATSSDLITLAYSSRYIEAGNPLSVLVFGLAFLAVFLVLAHIIMGGGKPNVVFGIALPLVAMDIALNITLIPRYELMGAAWATTLTGLIGMVAVAIYVLRQFKALVSARSFIKICLASLAIYFIAYFITHQVSLSPFFLLLIYVGLFAVYLGLLLVMKELSREDLDTFKRIIPLGRFGGMGE